MSVLDEQPAIPPWLFHYTNQPGLKGIASSKSVWASQLHYLNDGREFALCIDLVTEYVESLLPSATAEDTTILEALERWARNVSHSNVCVASFTERGDQLSRWRGYCRPGDGVSFGVEGALLQRSAHAALWWLTKCIYKPSEHRARIASMVDQHLAQIKHFLEEAAQPPVDEDHSILRERAWLFALHLANMGASIKDESFEEEREWRVVSPAQDFRKMQYRPGRHSLIPYAELPLVDVAAQPVRVRIGPTQYGDLSQTAAGGLMMMEGFTGYTVEMSEIPFRDW
jgi:hypothetical protein